MNTHDTRENTAVFRAHPRLRRAIYTAHINKTTLPALADFLSEGLAQGDLCVAALTPRHRRALNRQLRARGTNIKAALRIERYLPLHARELAALTDTEDGFDETAYQQMLETVCQRAAQDGQRVRAFGELLEGHRLHLGFAALAQHE